MPGQRADILSPARTKVVQHCKTATMASEADFKASQAQSCPLRPFFRCRRPSDHSATAIGCVARLPDGLLKTRSSGITASVAIIRSL